MRADRLLSLLMLLQTRGLLTAGELARELEVSVRTIYRDIDALSASGVPIITERGRGGGCALVDGYRSNLTGLTDEEVQALFMLSIPAALADLGLGPKLKAALLKLSASLPAERRQSQTWVRQRILVDWSQHPPVEEPVAHLQTMQRAVWEDRCLHLAYRLEYGSNRELFQRRVDAYGLVARAGIWHLVCVGGGRTRVYRVSGLQDVRLSSETFERSADFDLAAYWTAWCARSAERQPPYSVKVRVSSDLIAELPRHLGGSMQQKIEEVEAPDDEGRITVVLTFASLTSARTHILGFGGAVEVLEPRALRLTVADFAAQTAGLYGR